MKKNDWKWRWVLYGLIGFLFGCTDKIIYTVPDTSPFVYKNVALLVTKPTADFEPRLVQAMTQKVEQRLIKFPSFSRVLLNAQMESFFKQNIELKYQTAQFVSTFTLTGVSDKDISSRLGKALAVDQLLILDFNQYPCSKCDSGKQLTVKFHLLSATTGELLWRGLDHIELDEEEIAKKMFEGIVMESTETILDDFIETFKIPWHYQRYENLKKLGDRPEETHSS